MSYGERCEQCARYAKEVAALKHEVREWADLESIRSEQLKAKSQVVSEQYALLERISKTHPEALAGEKWR